MLFFIGLFTVLLCIPTVVWNHSMMKHTNKKKDIAGFVFSLVALTFAAAIFSSWYVISAHLVGGTVF